jgi:hypothetical protein
MDSIISIKAAIFRWSTGRRMVYIGFLQALKIINSISQELKGGI